MSNHSPENFSILEATATVKTTKTDISSPAAQSRPVARVLPSVQQDSNVLATPVTLTTPVSLTMHVSLTSSTSLSTPTSMTAPPSLTTPTSLTMPVSVTTPPSITTPSSRPTPITLTSPTPRGRIITCIVASVGGADTSTVAAVTQSRPCIIQLAGAIQHGGGTPPPSLSVTPAPPGPIAALHVFDGQALGLRPLDQASRVKVKPPMSGAFPVPSESIRWPSKPLPREETATRHVDSSTCTSPQSSPPRASPWPPSPHAFSVPHSPSVLLSSFPASTTSSSPSSASSSLSSTPSSGSSRSRTRTGSSRKTYPGDVSEAEVARMRLPGAVCRTVNVRMRRHYRRRLARLGMEGVNFRHVQRANESFCVRSGDRQFYRGLPLGVRHPLVLTPSPFCPDREKHLRGIGESMLELPLACPTCWSVQRNYPPFPHPAPRPRSRSRVRSPTPPRAPPSSPSSPRPHPSKSSSSSSSSQMSAPPTPPPLPPVPHSLPPQSPLATPPLQPSPQQHRRLALGV